ncbi:hypothetical protein [Fischerella thermalis]|uniref:hypothetical protein n=1 Tax=Fischerella thermalis TaxID=372787 RepID=UPI001ABBAD26|nr:hypothetical protein [Fischerella thermalis]
MIAYTKRSLFLVRHNSISMILSLGIGHGKIISILITNYQLPITHYRPQRKI